MSKEVFVADNAPAATTKKPACSATSGLVSNLYRVQVGAFSKKDCAEKKKQAVEAAGFDAYLTCMDNKLWRVQIGEFSEKADADKLLQKVQEEGFSGYVTKLCGKVVK